MKKLGFIVLIVFLAFFTSCENSEWDFQDHEYSAVYFSYQTPVRTLVLGKDYVYDNSLDNQHKCKIMATLGGKYEVDEDVTIDVRVDNSLCSDLKFDSEDGDDVEAMPSDYYNLPENKQIVIPSGEEMMGGIEVELTDAFFEDTLSTEQTYVIPLVMESVANADSILRGEPAIGVEDPDPRVADDWTEPPKNYVLYAVQYINPWDGYYLRRGEEEIDQGGNGNIDDTRIYREDYIVDDQVVKTDTETRNQVSLALSTKDENDVNMPFELMLTFDEDEENQCDISGADPSASYTVESGEGEYLEEGDEFGDKKRDVLYLDYTIDFGTATHSFSDTLVLRDRGVSMETFDAVLVNQN